MVTEVFGGTKVDDAEASVVNIRVLRVLATTACNKDTPRQLVEVPRVLLAGLGGTLAPVGDWPHCTTDWPRKNVLTRY